jgi:hypothetical protein
MQNALHVAHLGIGEGHWGDLYLKDANLRRSRGEGQRLNYET